jgi:hypothetical protein
VPTHVLNEHHVSPQAALLPFLDQLALYNEIQLGEWSGGALNEPPTSKVNSHLLDDPVEVFVCPSDSPPTGGNNYRACRGTTTAYYRPSRPAPDPMLGHPDMPRPGVFASYPRRAADVRDGLSVTAFFSERVVGDGEPQSYDAWRDVLRIPDTAWNVWISPNELATACADADPGAPAVGGPPRSYAGWTWLLSGKLHTLYSHVLPPNSWIPDCGADDPKHEMGVAAISARSMHPEGVNVAYGDGTVRFEHESIDLAVWRAASTIGGQE